MISVAVAGLGRIGMAYDLPPADLAGRSHAGAARFAPGAQLVGGVDPAPDRRAVFFRFFNCPAYPGLDEMMIGLTALKKVYAGWKEIPVLDSELSGPGAEKAQ